MLVQDDQGAGAGAGIRARHNDRIPLPGAPRHPAQLHARQRVCLHQGRHGVSQRGALHRQLARSVSMRHRAQQQSCRAASSGNQDTSQGGRETAHKVAARQDEARRLAAGNASGCVTWWLCVWNNQAKEII